MAKEEKHRPRMQRRTPVWPAPDEVQALMGDVSGNELNGWNEPEVRQPTPVMWANPAKLAHGDMQIRMTEEFVAHPELHGVLRMSDRHEPLAIAPEQTQRSSQQWIAALTEFSAGPSGHGVELVGVTQPQAAWFFEGRQSVVLD